MARHFRREELNGLKLIVRDSWMLILCGIAWKPLAVMFNNIFSSQTRLQIWLTVYAGF